MVTGVYQPELARETEGQASRIEGYDAARALAIFGMIVVNFKLVMGSSAAGPAWLVALAGLFEGRAAALFVMLAGVGLILLSRRALLSGAAAERRQARQRIVRRALVLLLAGLLLQPIWPADILHFYGLYLAVGAAMLFVPDRWLLLAAGLLAAGFAVLFMLFDYSAGWNWATLEYGDVWTARGLTRSLFFNGFHPLFPWCAFLLFGMWLGRQEVGDRHWRRRMLRGAVLTLLLAEAGAALGRAALAAGMVGPRAGALFSRGPMPPTPFYVLSAGSSALIVLLLALGLSRRAGGRLWWRALVATGQLALTLYIAHILLGMGLIEALGWLDGGRSLSLTLLYALGFYAGAIIIAVGWRRWFQRGPCEALVHWLTS
jgi:uncharacterized protein